MAAYHLEALRRQRVIDRKVEALSRMSMRQVRNQFLNQFQGGPGKICRPFWAGLFIPANLI